MNPSLEEIRRCTQVLEAIDSDRTLLAAVPEPERIALLRSVGQVAMPERDSKARLQKARHRFKGDARRAHDKALRDVSGIREARRAQVFVAPQKLLSQPLSARPKPQPEERLLEEPRDCYVCKVEFRKLHHFYDCMCTACGDLNYERRFQVADLRGKVALITGGRVKIGFQASLLLLRSGARVIATTRFPNDATERYAREPDFADWQHRLHLHGLDLRHAPSVELLANHLSATHDRLDILINNAAQTVRRPPGFYRHLLEGEERPRASLSKSAQQLLEGHAQLVDKLGHGQGHAASGGLAPTWRSGDPGLGVHASAALSLVPYDLEQAGDGPQLFPRGKLDADQQQVDLREINSWRLTLSQVATAEMLEVHLVNAVAPFILCGKLKGLMLRDRREPGHIVNVSAMEGSFSRGTKTDKHPHTNMAKAALNMLTLTSAPDYAKSNIFMNAVDTGWVTDEDPVIHAERKTRERDFHPPLDIVDGAARVVDPVFEAVRTGETPSGLFLKDYKPTRW